MPFYEYECQACKYYTEVMQKIADAPLRRCPSCGKRTLKKLVSAPVFRLKGGGWYETDFKSDKESKRNLLGERQEAKPAGAGEAKPEAAAAKASGEAKEPKQAKEPGPAPREAPADTQVASRGRVSVPVKASAPARRRTARRGTRPGSRRRR
jgi:putative FmdB family regulatory protein